MAITSLTTFTDDRMPDLAFRWWGGPTINVFAGDPATEVDVCTVYGDNFGGNPRKNAVEAAIADYVTTTLLELSYDEWDDDPEVYEPEPDEPDFDGEAADRAADREHRSYAFTTEEPF